MDKLACKPLPFGIWLKMRHYFRDAEKKNNIGFEEAFKIWIWETYQVDECWRPQDPEMLVLIMLQFG